MWLNYINLHEKSFDNKIKYKDSYLKWAKLKNTVFSFIALRPNIQDWPTHARNLYCDKLHHAHFST